MKRFHVTLGQIALDSRDAVLVQMDHAFAQSPDGALVVFPEFVAHGVAVGAATFDALSLDEAQRASVEPWVTLTPTRAEVRALADEHGRAVVYGCIERRDGGGGALVSRACYYDPIAGAHAHYDKTHVHWTESYLAAGGALRPVPSRFGALGLLVCFDLAFVEPTRALALAGADVLVVLSAVPETFSWRIVRRRVVGAAVFNQRPLIAANLGWSEGAPMGGHSLIVDARGEVLALRDGSGAGVVGAEIDLEAAERWREQEPVEAHRRASLYRPICDD